ncbi:hypothetical protein [Streptomyces sp. NBC_00989]|uniref:hypothetical protein n=1 Tax=Streptomyces sp. NBC_00989 TaxID=2903705 RepID=UPI00386D4A87|nr:hypothetical protein OG714_51780 [Streptomyces sp. NBC_00989]
MHDNLARRSFMSLTGTSLSLGLIGAGGLLAASSASPARAADTPDGDLAITGLTFTPDVNYAIASGANLRFDFYQGKVQPAGTGMENTPTPPQTPTPVVIWVPEYGLEEYVAGRNRTNVDSKYPTPIASYLAYGYAVISATYALQASKSKDLRLLITYLKSHADDLIIDTDNVGVLTATRTGYTASISVSGGKAGDVTDLTVDAPRDTDYEALITTANTKKIAEYFTAHIGGTYDASDPLDMTTPDVSWVDPSIHTSELGEYHAFPSPSRGRGAYASYAIYLPAT